MKAITIYEAEDGSRFDVQSKCDEYESLAKEIARHMDVLGHRKIEGATFHQHSPVLVNRVAQAVTDIAVERLIPERKNEKWHPHSMIQRFADESGLRCLRDAIWRIANIDLETGREYEQQYFRLHPNEATKEI